MSTSIYTSDDRNAQVKRIMMIVLLLNLAVALAKIVTGQVFGSSAVEADGIHSIFDAASNIVGLIGLAFATRPADASHPYGHAKYETFASAFIGCLLLLAAWEVGFSAVQSLMSGVHTVQASPVSFAVMVVTIVINFGVTVYERRAGKRYGSALLGADAKHTFSDVMVSASVIVGLIFVACGFPIADSIASLVVTVAICLAAVSVFKEVHDTFSDEARIDEQCIEEAVMSVPGARRCHRVRTRGMESAVYADLHVLVDPELSVGHAHDIAHAVQAHLQEEFPQIQEVLVHVEPDTPKERKEAA